MNFFEHQDYARKKTGHLVYLFAAAVIAIVVTVYLLFATLFTFSGETKNKPIDYRKLWNLELFLGTLVGVGGVITLGSVYRSASLKSGGKNVAEMLGGRLLDPSTRDLQERRLLNVVEEMALASGMPVPPVYLMDNEAGVNAFAAGFTPADAVIGVTRGTVEALTRDELQGVIAHEYSHILNGDMRLNIRLIGVLYGILLLSMIGYLVMRMIGAGSNSSSRRSSGDDKKGGGGALAFFLLGLGLYVIGYIGVFFGHLIKSAVSRQREYLADASAVQFTRNPDGIAGALKKIGALGSRIRNEQAEQASHMFFGNGLKPSFLNMLSTHPPLIDRIQRIQPTFDGDFSKEKLVWPAEEEVSAPPEKKKRAAGKGSPFGGVFGQAMGAGGVLAGFDGGASVGGPGGGASRRVSASGAVKNIGEPSAKHFVFAATLLEQMPDELTDALHDPIGATQVIYALLLQADPTDDEPGLRLIASMIDHATADETRRLVELVAPLGAPARLPMAQIAMSALRRLTPAQFDLFRKTAVAVIRSDRRVSMFEYCLQRLIMKHLGDFFRPKPPKKVEYKSVDQIADQVAMLLSAAAYAGADVSTDDAALSYDAGKEKFGPDFRQPLGTRDSSGFAAVDTALDALSRSTGAVKQAVLEACAATIGADGRMTIDEGELLRTIADALDCPMPPPAADLMPA